MDKTYSILCFFALLSPLASAITVGLMADRHRRAIAVIATFWLTIGFLSALMLFLARHNHPPLVISHIWLHVGSHSFEASLALSNQSLLMLVVVSVISLLVHIYSNVYMGGDPDWKKYFAMLGFFTFSMQGIVLSDNLLFLFFFLGAGRILFLYANRALDKQA